jgi:capsular polysaccharide biosynthesis protein
MQTPLPSPTNEAAGASDEIEIDLRKYVTIVTRRWRLLLTCTLIAAILGALISRLMPAPYEATSTVAMVRTATQVEFDPRFKTLSQDEVAAINVDSRRATLIGLVQNGAIAGKVAQELASQLDASDRNPSDLLDKVSSSTSGRGDLILIKVRDQDPEKAAAIASAWAREYERYVNSLYVGAPADYGSSVSQQYQRALEEANRTQTALESYIATSDIDQLQRSITETRQLLDALQQGKQNAVTLVISEQLKANSAIIAAYLGAQSANRLVAFEKEQEGRRNLIRTYLDAQNDAQVKVFSGQVQADLDRLQGLHTAQVRLRQFIGDATAMRDQVQAGGDAAAQSNSMALNLLKSQAFALTVPISTNVQIQLQNQTVPVTADGQLADLEALVSALTKRDAALSAEIEALSAKILRGEGYELDTPNADQSRIAAVISATYPSLFELGAIGRLSEAVPVTNPLTIAAQEKASDILRFQSSNLSTGALIENGHKDETITRLQSRLQEVQAQLEKEQATFDRLKQERDLKRETAETLARKQAEVGLASAVAGSEVRLASPALAPERRTVGTTMYIVIAALIGLVIGIILAFVIHAFLEDKVARIPKTGAFNRAARWVLAGQ